ncbi:MAG TPA: APC family permease [Actinomycetota bacterium]|nr:APC family permease [Actinomycetota bacterium]
MATSASLLKRVLLGRQVATSRMEHTLLPKVLALPVFSSDPLSSNAYATEEMMLVLIAAGAGALAYRLPIAVAIATVLIIVIVSYRQTVRAYPGGGGSYIVARENLGTLPGLVAAAAILSDYVLTVAVSVVAGAVAVTSAAPALTEHRVALAIAFVVLLTVANLRGVREAGTLFAVPTYGFVAMVYVMLGTGLVRCVSGCPVAETADLPLEATAGVSLFLILRAFSSGATALTGVEAIADGVSAFRRPQARNAAATLSAMGFMTVTMFIGITLLSVLLQVRVNEEVAASRSVLSQIGETVFGRTLPFYLLQALTAGILILAANTSYQDFPRLSAILARDRFMPRQFENRGDRLVFSNGVVFLAALAVGLIVAFEANLTRLIQLYVVGVFTAFTLSQAGMVRRWFRLREEGWRRRMVINAVGASATGLVLVIVATTKFVHGAWIVIVAMPVIVLLLRGVNRHYSFVRAQLHAGRVRFGDPARNRVVLVVTELDAAAAQALGYVRSFRPTELHPVYAGSRPAAEVEVLWDALSRTGPPITVLEGRDRTEAVLQFVRALPREPTDFLTVVIPEVFRKPSLLQAVLRRTTFELKVRLLSEPQVVVTDVPVVLQGGRPTGVGDARPLVPQRVVALVFIGGVHDSTIRAVNYARSLEAAETRALYVALEPGENLDEILDRWTESGVEVPLDILQAPFRDLGPPVIEEVRRVTADPAAVAAVVMPEFLVTRWWHRLLHNNRALFIKRRLLFEPRVILSSVPFALGAPEVSETSEVP